MLGRTGRPHPRQAIARLRLIWLLLLVAVSAGAEEPADEQVPSMRLRWEWGGGERQVWTGELRVSEGRLLDPVALDIEADTPGTLRLEDDRLIVDHRTRRAYAGFDITVQAPLDASLTIALHAVDGRSGEQPERAQDARTIEIPLRRLLKGQMEQALDSEGNHLLVYRLSSDALRVELDHPHLIFEPGQILSGRLTVPLLGGLQREARVEWELMPARERTRLAHGDLGQLKAGRNAPAQFPLEIELPQQEGVYALHFGVIGQGRFRQTRLYGRQLQLVVLAASPPAESDEPLMAETVAADEPRRLVDEIEPAPPGFFRGRTLLRAPLVELRVRKTSQGSFLEMRRSEKPDECWVAYRLRIKHPGRPHMLDVSYPEHDRQSLAISIVEPNPAGRVRPVGQDSGFYTGDPGELRQGIGRHQLLFWPRTSSPLLLLTNLGPQPGAAFGRIRVFELQNAALPGAVAEPGEAQRGISSALRKATNQAMEFVIQPVGGMPAFSPNTSDADTVQANPQSPDEASESDSGAAPISADSGASSPQPPAEPARPKLSQDPPPSTRRAPPDAQRLFGPYLHKPLFPENFGASEQLEQTSGRSLDDWVTFWEGAHRLVAYLKQHGYNSLTLAVLADGSTIYPSRLLEPTPRYDMGIFFPDGHDPLRKDVLELLFRLFDREGLILVPEVQFTAPLPELERLLAEQPEGTDRLAGIRLIGADGRDWLGRFGSYRGSAPYYNPLDPRVQQQMLRVVEELADRYGRHPSFGGLAVQLSADGYAQLPGADWGYDAETIARFAADSKTALPQVTGRVDRTAQYHQILMQRRKEWLGWRARVLSDLYRRIAETVRQSRGAARLYLTATHALAGSVGASEVYAALQEGHAVEDLLLERGIDGTLIAGTAEIVWLRPAREGTLDHLRGGALDTDINTSPQLDELFRTSAVSGTLFFHRPYTRRLTSFEQSSPWKDTYLQLVAQPSPAGVDNRRRFAHALAAMDAQVLFDGGWLIPMGQEETLEGWIEAFCRLPPARFTTVQPKDASRSLQPVTVRRYASGERTFLYLVNDSSWAASATVWLPCAPETELGAYGSDYSVSLHAARSSVSRLDCRLGAYGLCVVELPVRDLEVSDLTVEVAPSVRSDLEAEIASLKRRLAESQRRAPTLQNAGFEQPRADEPSLPEGWTFAPADRFGRARLDGDEPQAGRFALRCSSRGTLTSAPFPAPQRAFLGLLLRLRSDRQGVSVRLAFEGETRDGSSVRRLSQPIQVRREWGQYMFRVFDLPHEQLDELRARLELVQDADVWVDGAELVAFPLKKNESLELGKTVVNADVAFGDGKLSDCRRLLDSYWARFVKQHLPDPDDAEPNSTAVLTR